MRESICVNFCVLMSANAKYTVLRDVTPFSLVKIK